MPRAPNSSPPDTASTATFTFTTPSSYTFDLQPGETYNVAVFGGTEESILPVTGLDTSTIAWSAIALMLAGIALTLATRTRRKLDTI
jgi:LPXTG-motif cell wall-anchored protein